MAAGVANGSTSCGLKRACVCFSGGWSTYMTTERESLSSSARSVVETCRYWYAPSTFALFEQAQAGKLTFVPSVGLMLKWYASDDLFFQATPNDFVATGMDSRPLSAQMLEMTEYYDPANAALFVYFDSLKDLRRQVAETDYAERERGVREWAARHTNTTARRWQAIDAYLARSPA